MTRFCLTIEEDRRTPDGRIRTSEEYLAHFFPHDSATSTDRVFRYMPNDVRGPILAAWGIRGNKAAARDNDEKVQSIVHDSLLAGDLDHTGFEDGIPPQTAIRWVPLADYWAFWRAGKLTKHAIRKALEAGDELGLFDSKWFLDTVEMQGGKVRGTDVLADGLSKADLTTWVRRIHESRDGSPRGLMSALGWETIVAKTPDPVLISMLDAIALKIGLKVQSPVAEPRAAAAERAPAPTVAASSNGGGAGVPAPERPRPPAKSAAAATVAAPAAPAQAVVVPGPKAAAVASADVDDLLTDDDLDAPVAAPPAKR